MMFDYILRLLILVPLVGGLAFGSLWLWRRVQPGGVAAFGQRERLVKVVDALPMGTMGRLAVVEFGGRQLLLGVTRNGIQLIADEAARGTSLGD